MKLLHLDSSILGDASASRQLSKAVVEAWSVASPGVQVTYRDLASDALSHFSAASLVAAGTPAELRDAAQRHETELAERTLEEFLAADAIVIGAPMYNFAIPSQLKAWIDRIAVAGKTFKYTENGVVGLAGGKTVVIASSAGGVHAGLPSGQAHEDYLVRMLNFVGIDDIEIVRAEGLAYGDEPRAEAMKGAAQRISELFATA
ncbi:MULTISPECIES: FMN-dependent NADH-azoreductase [Pseudomonas]|uniref:FMN dependent NADH:quinone oxidoreductase n=2 Tax=Ectopseudomonas TaxID=3236654 RepID=A0A653AXT6_ECTOL|nr:MULTISPECIES: FMN-dependent NADH-azoreductase [Pseudomonas]CAE6932431.1 FMN-dependent NADH-azoreductase 2 [Pseudomonas oleovorans]QFT22633.1 FMN-dependent NADH-azoreductase 1 [Pseudomonas sp. THAF187a]QFT42820.1 FMN-dependent NADH-azoreductase 1 [Pseudomonas sp. THAF42]QTS84662.1 FMN-dependent NADH-azoreductase [Pseudomonas khazarica]WFC62897.1 FMN-dependent NADH-azoreductase [Pseudomonas sp. REST10]|tara:strand:- start:6301 stop:6909 length:609 start_codon:yes stop_codon:yes gene_type:complete